MGAAPEWERLIPEPRGKRVERTGLGTDCHLSGREWLGREICSLKNSRKMLITREMCWCKKIVKNFTKEY
jgi:hypothetical protein